MGFLDWLERKAAELEAQNVAAQPQARTWASARPAGSAGRGAPSPPPSPDACWVPEGRPVRVGGRQVAGGLFYLGRGLPALHGWGPEPALVDPHLPVDYRRPDWSGDGLPYWPSYTEIPPTSRAAYLSWLADGRRHPSAPVGYAFLFFYGLERRVLADAIGSATARVEVDRMLAEVRGLLGVYGREPSFHRYATTFLDFVDVLRGGTAAGDGQPPAGGEWGEASPSLKLGLGRFAVDGRPIPPLWALAWLRASPDARLRTPATRCPEEFTRLFTHRYTERFGGGLVVRPNRTPLALAYQPASPTFGGPLDLRGGNLPDVTAQSAPVRTLAELADQCCEELDAFSRYVGKHPEGRESLAAVALLPDVLTGEVDSGEATSLRDWVAAGLADRPRQVVPASALIDRWPAATPARLVKSEAVALAQLLAKFGYGIEPDARFGTAVPNAGHVVLFRLGSAAPSAASSAYAAAMILLHLAVAVSDADGEVSDEEQRRLTEHMEAALHLSTAERQRLDAHLAWLLTDRPGLAGIKRRLEALDQGQRVGVGQFLVTVAAADGTVTPSELKLLQRIHRMLELDPTEVQRQVRALTPAPPAATEPVTVRPAALGRRRFAIPAARSRPGPTPAAASPGVALDPARVEAKLAESVAVSVLLGSIFTGDEAPPAHMASTLTTPTTPAAGAAAAEVPAAPPPPGASPTAQPPPPRQAAGLDAAHTALLESLAAKPVWARAEIDALAAERRLMVDGALDTINDAAIDRCGEPACEGDDPIEMNPPALQELLR